MLNQFRTKRTASLSALLIIISLMIKMMMPVAHASTAMSGEKGGFFAALCTANGIVYVNADGNSKPLKTTPETQQVSSNSLCPLCLLLEQGLYDSTVLHSDTALSYALRHTHFPTFNQPYLHAHHATQRPIRAPPVIS